MTRKFSNEESCQAMNYRPIDRVFVLSTDIDKLIIYILDNEPVYHRISVKDRHRFRHKVERNTVESPGG